MAQFYVINVPLAFTVPGDMQANYRVQEGPRKSQKVLEIIILYYSFVKPKIQNIKTIMNSKKQPLVNKGSINDCQDCKRGYFQNFTGQQGCSSCPKGQYCSSSRTFLPENCPAGTYQESFFQLFHNFSARIRLRNIL